jgi:hypothetical protein
MLVDFYGKKPPALFTRRNAKSMFFTAETEEQEA